MIDEHINNCPQCLTGGECIERDNLVQSQVRKNADNYLAVSPDGNFRVSLYSHGTQSAQPYSLKISYRGDTTSKFKTLYPSVEEVRVLEKAINRWLHSDSGCG
jgi:hypothetical protein